MTKIVLKRCGRYALIAIMYDSKVHEYVCACGYNDKTHQWNQGFYSFDINVALDEFNKRSSPYCSKCEYTNEGCIICKKLWQY